ncbi:hypothetical protein QR685DRAFT_519308 [Neurospora intermedia]|uniref:Uncharacterized protein n=1 Tax=Neurospora intermedia TaxID=5142 RepID=A0ABR3DGT2_NEUIN
MGLGCGLRDGYERDMMHEWMGSASGGVWVGTIPCHYFVVLKQVGFLSVIILKYVLLYCRFSLIPRLVLSL